MKKHSFLLSILFLFPLFVLAQVDISISKPYKVVDAPEKYYFYKGNEILSIKIAEKRITIQKFNSENLSFIKEKIYEDMPKGSVIENVEEFNDRYYIFYSLWDKPNKKEQLFYRELDFESGSFIGKDKLLFKVNGKVTGTLVSVAGGWGGISVKDKFDFQFSFNESKMLIKYRLKPKIKDDSKNYDVIGICVFDENLEPVWSEEVKMPYTEKKINNLDYYIDSEGNTYILATLYDDNTTDLIKRIDGKPNYHLELLSIEANSGNINKIPIKLNDMFINNMNILHGSIRLFESPKGYMACAGFYNYGKDPYNANGVFLFKVEKEGKIYDMATYEIPVEVLKQYVSEKTRKKIEKKDSEDKAEFEELVLRQLNIREDGSLILIGEQHYVKTKTTYYSGGRYTTISKYYYNDMLVTKIDANGELSWMRKLPKRQLGHDGEGGMSYKYISDEDNHYLLFLDNVGNMNLPLNKVPSVHGDGAGGFLTAYKIDDSEGVVSKVSILDIRDVKGMEVYQFSPSSILPLSSNEFVFEVYKKNKEDVLIKVTFND